ncbi:MAG: proline--tRNA ligase, partial [Clostridia bacterium]|nr:proline--tRNA ligase [Clostridia bacterium]
FLQTPLEESCKAVIYQKNMTDEYVVVFIRGDLDVNETKLTNYLGEAVHPGEVTEDCGLYAGFTGPYNIDREKFTILFDKSLEGTHNLSCGANQPEHHYTGLKISRDIGEVEYIDLAKITEGGICPKCGKHSISISRGIEVGNIFQLGTKYTKSMNMQYLDSEGNLQYPIMGCYGIGVGRLAASVCEAHHDDYGPIWPMSIAPWHVEICCLRADDEECKGVSDKLYDEMLKEKMEVIYDDRNIRPGAMFSDADLLGIPLKVVVSPRNLAEGVCEINSRDKEISEKIPVAEVIPFVKSIIEKRIAEGR